VTQNEILQDICEWPIGKNMTLNEIWQDVCELRVGKSVKQNEIFGMLVSDETGGT
jgi:hypothetical protein